VISLTVNGKQETLDREASVEEVLRRLGVEPAAVAVEVNRKIVPRKLHSTCVLRDGDQVEVVTFVGGG
jgi:thiamine biosynthesis protein ThiS